MCIRDRSGQSSVNVLDEDDKDDEVNAVVVVIVDDVVAVAPANFDKSELSHHTGMPSPQIL